MSAAPRSVASEEAREKYIQEKINEYRERAARLSGRKIRYFDTQEKKNERWWNACATYTLLAVFIILMVGAVIGSVTMGVVFYT